MNKAELIRKEIERRLKQEPFHVKNLHDAYTFGLESILRFIDSLPEESEELTGLQKEVAEGYVGRIDRKRIPIEFKGEIKHKFKNEFNTMWQVLDGIQFANVAGHIIERLCLHFAAWGSYNLKDIGAVTDKSQLDTCVEEPALDDLGISQEDYAKAVDECIFGKKEPASEDLDEAAEAYAKEIIHNSDYYYYL